jgi:hypothetical protein
MRVTVCVCQRLERTCCPHLDVTKTETVEFSEIFVYIYETTPSHVPHEITSIPAFDSSSSEKTQDNTGMTIHLVIQSREGWLKTVYRIKRLDNVGPRFYRLARFSYLNSYGR